MAKALAAKDAVSTRMRSIRRVLWIVLVLNLAVAAAKYVYGTVTGSASMQADGIHSVFDSAGNVVGLVGIALASRPADEGHPYGHAKFETYASLVIGVLLLLAAFEVGSSAVAKLASGSYTAEVTPLSFAVMAGTLAVNLGVTTYERRCAKRLKSEVLGASASSLRAALQAGKDVICVMGPGAFTAWQPWRSDSPWPTPSWRSW